MYVGMCICLSVPLHDLSYICKRFKDMRRRSTCLDSSRVGGFIYMAIKFTVEHKFFQGIILLLF